MPSGEQHGVILPTKATIRATRAVGAQEQASLLEKAKSRALEWDDSETPVFFDVVASGNEVDSYGTFMMSSTLRNFAEDAERGVSVLDSHNHMELGFGQSLTGRYIADGDSESMESTFFTLPDMEIGGKNTNTYIRGIKRGMFRDISVGFWLPPDAVIRCSICGKDMMRWWSDEGCWHFPGNTYEIEGDGTTRREVALGGIDGARLTEYSLVYDGATPGAGVAKARQMEDAGKLDARTAGELEGLYQTTFPRATGRWFAGFTPAVNGGRNVDDEIIQQINAVMGRETGDPETPPVQQDGDTPAGSGDPETLPVQQDDDEAEVTTIEDPEDDGDPETPPVGEAGDDGGEGDDGDRSRTRLKIPVGVRTAFNQRFAEHKIQIGENVGEALDALGAEILRVRGQRSELRAKVAGLEREAADGRTYRAHLTDDMVTEAIRAMNFDGTPDPEVGERYRAMVKDADLEHIRKLRDDFARMAGTKYGQRTSRDDALDGARLHVVGAGEDDPVPDEAYYGNA